MATFTKRAGDTALKSTEDPTMLLVGDTTPDTVRLPPNLGGHVVRVVGSRTARCPKCTANVKHLHLDGGISVAECAVHHFLWYRTPSATSNE